jgi:hypothetical protein
LIEVSNGLVLLILHGVRDTPAVESHCLVLVVLFARLNKRRAGGNAGVRIRTLAESPVVCGFLRHSGAGKKQNSTQNCCRRGMASQAIWSGIEEPFHVKEPATRIRTPAGDDLPAQ